MPEITFDVERDGEIVATGLSEPTFPDTGLSAGTSYDYRVRARDEYGVGPWSDTLTVTTETSGVEFSDSFTYSDGQLSTVSSGQWSTSTGNASNVMSVVESAGNVSSGVAVLSGSSQLVSITPIGIGDVEDGYFVEADLLQSAVGSTTPYVAIVCRWAGVTGQAQGIGLRIRLTSPSAMITELFTITGTTINVLDSSTNDLPVAGGSLEITGTIRLEVSGNAITGKVDGVAVVSATNSTHNTNTGVAVLVNKTAGGTHSADNFQVGILA